MELQGKVAFLTGGANGIGKAYLQALLARGVKVCFTDVDKTNGESTLKECQKNFGKGNVSFYAFDITNDEDFENAFKKALSSYGTIDIMINNAGIMNEGAWSKMIDINVHAVVKGVKLAESVMRKDKGGKGGRVINISSCVGLNHSGYLPIYTATKHAVRAYTTSLSVQLDLKEQGIQYASLCPDPVDTDLVRKLDATKIQYYEEVKDAFGNSLHPSRCVEGMLQLLELENMNGAILFIRHDALVYQAMERKDIGLCWNPDDK